MNGIIKGLIIGVSAGAAVALTVACGATDGSAERHEAAPRAARQADTASGGLIQMDMTSTVGVMLDEIPAGPLREAAAANALAQPSSFWIGRAGRQTRLTSYFLVFRGEYYSSSWANTKNVRGPLPLPPESTWKIQLVGTPHRTTIDSHDYVAVDYAFHSMIVTDANSPGAAEPNLASIGGTWDEPFTLPVDPELLFQRTGYACMDEDEFPPGSVFEENTWYFYDDTCTSGSSYCHVTEKPQNSCNAELKQSVGRATPAMHFTRVAYDPTVASQYRVGTINPDAIAAGSAPDLAVVQDGITNERAIFYRFFPGGSCDLGEGTIGKLGWRRLMSFSAIVQNNGTGMIQMGNPTDPSNPYAQSNAFEYSACHNHYHFSHYGTFQYGTTPGSKRAFCLEDTNRYHNDETTTLMATHQTCENQGIEAGWGDEYNFGIPGQWVDVTETDTTTAQTLSFLSNPDQFLCEGTPVLDSSGNFIFDPTSFTTQSGLTQYRIRCNFLPSWSSNNFGSVSVSSPGGSFVTEACTRGQAGPKRDCGFAAQSKVTTCTAGATVDLTCTAKSPQVLRVCETSGQLGVGVACAYRDSAANVVVGTSPTAVSFTCPSVRDAAMVPDSTGTPVPTAQPGVGGYALYHAAMGTLSSGDDSPGGITCR